MDPDLYRDAAEGDIGPFSKIANDRLRSVVTHIENTVLHVNIIASQSHERNREGERDSTKFVKRILRMCPSLLLQVNAKGDAPLDAAAKYGQAAVVRALIEFAKKQPGQELESGVKSSTRQMLGMENDEKNTALHEAVQSGSLDVVEILLEADPDFPYSANGSGETPLYLAAAVGHKEIVDEILQQCPAPAHEGPNRKTALHAAVCSFSYEMPILLTDKMKSLIGEKDRHGWTPLHYAAYLNSCVIPLLEADKSPALIADEERKMTALHLAAGRGNFLIVFEIIDHCPECCELVDNRGWNVLHFAMVSFSARKLKRLVRKYPVVRNLIFKRDVKGNTPFHVLAAVSRQSFRLVHDIVPDKIARACYQVVNKQNITVRHIFLYGSPDIEKEIQELSKADGSGLYPYGVVTIKENKRRVKYSFWKNLDEDIIGMKEASDSHLVVAALIATVTFAAAFTLPGGYKSDNEDDPNRGTAILSKNTAFQAFVISDAIATVLSLSAVFVHFILSLKLFKKFIFLFVFALSFTLVAMAAMMVAFVTGTYAVLAAPSLGLAIVTCIIGLTFFLLVIFMFNMVISKIMSEAFEWKRYLKT